MDPMQQQATLTTRTKQGELGWVDLSAKDFDGQTRFYEALFGRLVQSEPLSGTELGELATQRAQAIADFVAQTGVDAGRIAVGKTQTVDDHAKPLAARLALDAAS